ncbi:hypothetical protein BZL30_5299 [Mycobacterium kansasii]|uniref:Uncharacterized protein n=1 Tax=Mycobacterium kansasii TaxID=1768 RepID=A0A1V3WYC4_MYCKA|nr:hypothetical protein BZL30_5299 [Mycobacterium kansasii]
MFAEFQQRTGTANPLRGNRKTAETSDIPYRNILVAGFGEYTVAQWCVAAVAERT